MPYQYPISGAEPLGSLVLHGYPVSRAELHGAVYRVSMLFVLVKLVSWSLRSKKDESCNCIKKADERLIINIGIYILFSTDLMIVRLKGKDTGNLIHELKVYAFIMLKILPLIVCAIFYYQIEQFSCYNSFNRSFYLHNSWWRHVTFLYRR